MRVFRIVGRVLVAESGEGVAGLVVEASDADFLIDDHLGRARTGREGQFEIKYEEEAFVDLIFDKQPDIYLEVKDEKGNVLHSTAGNIRYDADEVEEFTIRIPRAALPGEEGQVDDDLPRARGAYRQLLLENLNYFGTYPELDLKAVEPKQGDTHYEELKCIGFYPEQDLLEAVLHVKRATGYRSSLCGPGSHEYVRFFVDWDGDGDFEDAGEDAGIASVNVHNIPNEEGRCRRRSKPLAYTVQLRLDPRKLRCQQPYLVKVRAILSWDTPPPAGMPNKPPVWGNVIEGWIQIEPRPRRWFDVLDDLKLKEVQLDPDLLQEALPISPIAHSAAELEELYKEQEVPAHRYQYGELSGLVAQVQKDPNLLASYFQNPELANIAEKIKAVLAEKAETRYEELKCVGLVYDQDQLAATMTIKRPSGYNGDLCHRGSREYVAFWAYVYDQIEQQCIWRYLGTTSVGVHDIPNIPNDGLQYAVYLPVNLDAYRRRCHEPQVLKVRAVLSWNTPPSTTDPFEEPRWGNIRQALIQLKPSRVPGGERRPVLWALGNMAVESISGNPYTTIGSSLGAGYANGSSVGAGFTALESPFGARIHISGTITNPPNNPAEADKLRYKVQYRKLSPTPGPWRDITNNFTIWRRIDGIPVGSMVQMADPGGYYRYQKDLTPPTQVEVLFDTLAIWHTPVPEGDGLYGIRVLLYQPGAPATATSPADHVASELIKVQIDNTAPTATLSLDAGPCEKFQIGDTFTGKLTATDKHFWKYLLSVSPSVATPPTLSTSGESYPALGAPGRTNYSYTVTTTASTTPCGYVINLRVYDRTIRNNHMSGNRAPADVGLCLLAEE